MWRDLTAPMTAMKKQAKSRKRLEEAVAKYVSLRSGDGAHNTVVGAIDRQGRRVTVFVELNILSDEG